MNIKSLLLGSAAAAVAFTGAQAADAIAGGVAGDIANVLTSIVLDPNCSIHEGKALTCAVARGRVAQRWAREARARGAAEERHA